MTTGGDGEGKRPFTVFLIAGEESGDQLGAGLMRALSERTEGDIRFVGVGGKRMSSLGLQSLYPMHDIGLHGIAAIIPKLAQLVQRRQQTVRAVLSEQPDVLITIDCPSFNLGVARRVRNIDPTIANIHYVLPSVWAYRPGRAKKMAGFIDHVLAILPFEPAVSRELAGPPCTYVGHLLIERVDLFRPKSGERLAIGDTRQPVLLVLPGSRRSEIRRLLEPFGSTVSRVAEALDRPLEVILPAVEHHLEEIRSGVSKWRIQPKIVVGESEKFRAFRRAHAALAASGTVTLELALAGVPMVVAYRIDLLFQWIRFIVRGDTIVLANLVVGEKVVPEFIDWQSTPTNMAEALGPLLTESQARRRQLDAFERLDSLMALDGTTPSARAAEIVLDAVERRQRRLVIGT